MVSLSRLLSDNTGQSPYLPARCNSTVSKIPRLILSYEDPTNEPKYNDTLLPFSVYYLRNPTNTNLTWNQARASCKNEAQAMGISSEYADLMSFKTSCIAEDMWTDLRKFQSGDKKAVVFIGLRYESQDKRLHWVNPQADKSNPPVGNTKDDDGDEEPEENQGPNSTNPCSYFNLKDEEFYGIKCDDPISIAIKQLIIPASNVYYACEISSKAFFHIIVIFSMPYISFVESQCDYDLVPSPVPAPVPRLADLAVASLGYGAYFPTAVAGVLLFLFSQVFRQNVKWVKRNPILVTLEISCFTLSILFFSLFYIAYGKVPVGLSIVFYFFFGFAGIATVFLRLCQIMVEFKKNKMLLTQKFSEKDLVMKENASRPTDPNSIMWIKARKFIYGKYSIAIIFAYSAFALTTVLVYLNPVGRLMSSTRLADFRTVFSKGSEMASFHWILMLSVCIIFGFILRNEGKESMGILRELEMKIMSALIVILASLLGNAPAYYEKIEVKLLLLWIALCWEGFLTIWLLAWKIYKERKELHISHGGLPVHGTKGSCPDPKSASRTKDLNSSEPRSTILPGSQPSAAKQSAVELETLAVGLDEVLQNARLSDLFQDFLSAEFSVENLLFLKAVEKLKEKWDSCKLSQETKNARQYVEDCVKIHDDFCDEKTSLAPINISYELRSNMEEKMNVLKSNSENNASIEINGDIFHQCEAEIRKLLSYDSLVRFLRSVAFLEFRASIDVETSAAI